MTCCEVVLALDSPGGCLRKLVLGFGSLESKYSVNFSHEAPVHSLCGAAKTLKRQSDFRLDEADLR